MQPQPQPIPQIPGNLIAGLAQLGPAAIPLLQSLQPQPNLTQQPGWTTPGHLGQATLQQGHLLQQVTGLLQGNHSSHVPLSVPGHPFQQVAYGQTTQNQGLLHPSPSNPLQQQLQQLLQTLQQPTMNPQQNSLLGTPAATALSQRHSTPQQGMSSMTGVMVVRPTEYSRFCSVDYAKKVKAENCNLVLYIWGYVAQILASKQGHIPAIPEQEQIGRLQHLLHILELSAMESSTTDFSSPAWLCARNYSDRVKFSGHSLRRGGATHLYKCGASVLKIQACGDWASSVFIKYLFISLEERLESQKLMSRNLPLPPQ